ncbi:sensor histidine kinase [Micromonospora sp. KC606]|uniref:sensor histidine kinase n=1 Tax=Micromonospora sp. KC606 TaxID=2530379 RepID=UPI0010513F82|nr:sensor histidine kinase [Micromonospora sp. KC606]TDC84203.1 sensor histidine kinase [Micromonospora sp. KC606]
MRACDRLFGVTATAGLAVAFLAAIVLQALAIAQTWGARYWLAGGTAAVVVCVLALVRRRQRAWAAVAGLGIAGLAIAAARVFHLPTEPGPAMALALAVLVGSAVRALPPVPAGALAAGGLAVVGGAYLAARPQSSGASGVWMMNVAAWLGAVAGGLALRLLDERATATVERVRRDERLELARELHDVVAHHVTGMLIQAQAAHLVARKNPGQVTESLTEIEAAGTEALRAMRRVVGLLRDTEDAPPASAGPEELGVLVERFSRQGPPVRLRLPDESTAWPPEVTSTVYRIIRESLTNVARHAPHARSVTVTVDQNPSGVTVEVVDDAPPGPVRASHRGGYGLIGMRERVETLGGTLHTGPRPDTGWSVLATLPTQVGRPR